MTGNLTFTIIKPHAVSDNNTGSILSHISRAGFRISAIKMTMLSRVRTEEFYQEHKGKDFFNQLVDMMSSGPIVVAVLEKENAVSDLRLLIGSTDPDKAEEGTVRKIFGKSMRENAIHASDSDENAVRESCFFFSELEKF
jgi:nucleoside-diphosphate kinase